MNSWQVGEVTVTSVVEIEAPVPGEAVIPSAAAAAEEPEKHRWLVPHFATEDGLLHLRIQLLAIESQGRCIAVDTCLGNDKPRTNDFFSHLQTPFLDTLEVADSWPEATPRMQKKHTHALE